MTPRCTGGVPEVVPPPRPAGAVPAVALRTSAWSTPLHRLRSSRSHHRMLHGRGLSGSVSTGRRPGAPASSGDPAAMYTGVTTIYSLIIMS